MVAVQIFLYLLLVKIFFLDDGTFDNYLMNSRGDADFEADKNNDSGSDDDEDSNRIDFADMIPITDASDCILENEEEPPKNSITQNPWSCYHQSSWVTPYSKEI